MSKKFAVLSSDEASVGYSGVSTKMRAKLKAKKSEKILRIYLQRSVKGEDDSGKEEEYWQFCLESSMISSKDLSTVMLQILIA